MAARASRAKSARCARGVQIIVATPGRLLDLINRGVVNLGGVHTVILDEADEMLNMGFLDDINAILENVPDNRKMLMFSATMPAEIAKIAKNYMHDPVEFVIGTRNEGAANVRHIYYMVNAQRQISRPQTHRRQQPQHIRHHLLPHQTRHTGGGRQPHT